MKRIALPFVFLCGASFAGTPTMTFPYGTDMEIRHQMTTPVEVNGSYEVPKVGDGMPASDTVVRSIFEMTYMEDVPAYRWESLRAQTNDAQAALCIRSNADGGCTWMGYSGGSWIELEGVEPHPGAWSVRIDLDYTQGTTLVKVRYSVRPDGSSDEHVLLHPKETDSPWLETGIAAGKRLSSVGLCGDCDVSSAQAESGRRQGYADTTTVEDYRMDYSGMALDVDVGETWGVDTLVVTVKDGNGNVKGEVQKALSDAQGGKVRLDLSKYMMSGESYTYDFRLTGAYGGTPVTCEKGETRVDLFSMADWFGFDGVAPVKANVQGLSILDGVLSATDPSVKGLLVPVTPESESIRTIVRATLSVRGAVLHWDLSALPVADLQGALVMAQFGGSVGRSWAVWSATAGNWIVVSGAGVGTANGSYDVRTEFDEIAGVRSARYSVRAGSDYVVLKDAQENEWFALPAAATRLNRVSLSGGGGISGLEASYKALGPVPEVTVRDGKIELSANTELDLANSALTTDAEYSVQNPPGKRYHFRWKDSKSGAATTKWAKIENGKLSVRKGAPANGLDSFHSYALGLDPEDASAKPVAVLKDDAAPSPDSIEVDMRNVDGAKLPDSGYEVIFRRQVSEDGGTTWADEDVTVGVGQSLTIPLDGKLYRVKTILR